MNKIGAVLCIVGAFMLIFGGSMFVVLRLPYYRDRVREQGNPARANAVSIGAVFIGVSVLVVGIALASSG